MILTLTFLILIGLAFFWMTVEWLMLEADYLVIDIVGYLNDVLLPAEKIDITGLINFAIGLVAFAVVSKKLEQTAEAN